MLTVLMALPLWQKERESDPEEDEADESPETEHEKNCESDSVGESGYWGPSGVNESQVCMRLCTCMICVH